MILVSSHFTINHHVHRTLPLKSTCTFIKTLKPSIPSYFLLPRRSLTQASLIIILFPMSYMHIMPSYCCSWFPYTSLVLTIALVFLLPWACFDHLRGNVVLLYWRMDMSVEAAIWLEGGCLHGILFKCVLRIYITLF